MKLYHHKTDGGAEYLTDTFTPWKHNGKSGKEGTFTDKTTVIVRIDGDITKDAEINGKRVMAYDELKTTLQDVSASLVHYMIQEHGAEKLAWILENSSASGLARARDLLASLE
jgi:hypothetical protein